MNNKDCDIQLNAIYARIGEFFANLETANCIFAYNSKESEIMKKCGLSYVGKAHQDNNIVEIFMKKSEHIKQDVLFGDFPIKPQTPPITTPSPYFPPGTRGNPWWSDTINCKY